MTGAWIDIEESPDDALARLQHADREQLDVPALRAALAALELKHGTTDAHRFATDLLRVGGAVVRHPAGHLRGLTASVLSPSGRHLAVGSQLGDDYDEGGALQLWEVATGRCVNMVTGIRGGVGWDGYPRSIQWSADGTALAVSFSTSQVGRWDPFGGGEPTSVVGVGDGASRPPAFALSPDGDRVVEVMLAPDGHDVHCGIMPLTQPSFWYDPSGNGPDTPDWPAVAFPDAVRAQLDDIVFPDRVYWSRGGERVYGHDHDWIFSVDLERREVTWVVGSGGWHGRGAGPAWSLDERWFAVQRGGRLVFCDALTGAPVTDGPAHPHRARLVWGARGAVRRLAVLVPDDAADGWNHVAVYDDGVHRYDVPVPVGPAHADDHDAIAWAWAPDGRHAAAVTDDGNLEVWNLGATPARVRALPGADGTHGVLWAADDVLVLVGETTLRYVDAFTGTVSGDFVFLREVPGPRPVDPADDLGGRIVAELGYDPTFALTDGWAAAFRDGVMIAPADRGDELDRLLAWTVDRRLAWPVRWGGLTVVPTLAAAARHVPALAGVEVVPPPPAAADAWPPPDAATVEDLFGAARAALDAVVGFPDAVDASVRLMARLRAYQGEESAAIGLIEGVLSQSQLCRTLAEVALILGGEHGRVAAARELFDLTDEQIEAPLAHYEVAAVAAAVGGACAVIGDTARADAWFARAKAAIEPETNPGQNRLAVIWALLVCGRVDEARELWTDTAEYWNPSRFHSEPLLAFLDRTGRDDLARELRGLAAFRDVRLAPAGPVPHEPTPAEVTDLEVAYAALMAMPRSTRRFETAHLVDRAARCGHISAVLSLLPSLPDGNYNDRAAAAVRALWTVTTGARVDPW